MQKVHLIRLHFLNYFRRSQNPLFVSPIQHGSICTLPFVSHKAGLVQDKLLALIGGIGSIVTSKQTHVPSTAALKAHLHQKACNCLLHSRGTLAPQHNYRVNGFTTKHRQILFEAIFCISVDQTAIFQQTGNFTQRPHSLAYSVATLHNVNMFRHIRFESM